MSEISSNKYLMNTYCPFNIDVKYGEGSYLFDVNNNKYIDFTSGIGVNSLGYNNSEWKESVISQLNSFQHLSNMFSNDTTNKLGEKLVKLSSMDKVFFSNSGAEANEAAIKLARKYSFMKYGVGRNKILTLKKSFHGRTLATVKATGQEKFHNYFFPFPEGFDYISSISINSLKEKLSSNVCAVIMEAVQGEGGVNPLDKHFVQELCNIAKNNDILVIFDEVQCGIGRTGQLFGYNHFDVDADIVTLAKGLGGGLPIGATLCNEKLSNVFSVGDHGSTYGGNPVACAGALSVLKQICKPEVYSSITSKGNLIKNTLSSANLQIIKDIRGEGLMIGIEIDGSSSTLQERALEKGLIVLTAGPNVVRLLPPLIIDETTLVEGLNILIEVLANLNCIN